MTHDRNSEKRAWLEGHLAWAADHFAVELIGPPVHGPRVRAVGAKARGRNGDEWLRVVFEDPEWGDGDYLGHNVAANDILDVPKPIVARWEEWDDNGRRMRGELMTYIADAPVSNSMILVAAPPLSDAWLDHLRTGLENLARFPRPDNGIDLDDLEHGLLAYFGIQLDPSTIVWTTAHTDLHWGNVTAPTLTILDWETWGRAPAGYDAATLYCTSLLDPKNARRVFRALSAQLANPLGQFAIAAAAVRLLRFVEGGEIVELAVPLRQEVERGLTNRDDLS